MLIKRILGASKFWGAPAGWDEKNKEVPIGTLPTKLSMTEAGPMWESAWEPTPEELVILNNGGTIHLFVSSFQHPVVALTAYPLVEDHDG